MRAGDRGPTDDNRESAMKARIPNEGRILGLDFADWSTLIVGFGLAGLVALYI
jgi:hypothetical protein